MTESLRVITVSQQESKMGAKRQSTVSSAIGFLTYGLILCLGLGSGADADGQETAAGFFDTVDVEVVNVEVFVTDKKGRPVSGLTVDDFELFHDGEPTPISNFYAASATAPREEAAPSEKIESAPTERAPIELMPIEQRLNLVIFIDNRNIDPKNRNRVIDALRGSLFFNLRPDDRVTLVAYDGALDIRQGLTGDPRKIAEALDEMAGRGATGIFSRSERTSLLRELQQTDLEGDVGALSAGGGGFSQGGGAGADWQGILQQIRTYTQEEFLRIGSTVEAMASFIDTLSGLPGRKALVYVSDGLSLRPGEALFQAFGRKAPPGTINADNEAREYDATQLFEKLGKLANASRVTFYSILAAGGSAQTLTPAERSAFVNADSGSFNQVWSEGLETIERANFSGSMRILAEATGGLATLNTRNFDDALRRVQQDLGTFYSIGYEAPGKDNENHRIKVNVKRPGLQVRHRETFRLRSSDEEMQVRTHSALVFDEPSNPLGIVVEFGPPKEDDKGLFLVPVIVKFPLAKIVLAPGEKTHDGQVSIYVGARKAKGGDLSPVQKLPAPVHIPNDKLMTALGQVAGYRMMLQLRPGEHTVAVSVRDEIAQVESTTVVTYDATTAAAEVAAEVAANAAPPQPGNS